MQNRADTAGESRETLSVEQQLYVSQMGECWADIRNYDTVLWQIPAAISAIGGLMVVALVQPEIEFGAWARPIIAFAAALLTLPLVVALVKNRLFQTDRNNWRIALYKKLVEGGSGPVQAGDYKLGEVPVGLVPLGLPRTQLRLDRGPLYWRLAARAVYGLSAFNVLLLVSLVVFFGEIALGTLLALDALVAGWTLLT